jgi:maleate isomerase
MNNDVRRIGVLIPPGNIAMERELPIHAPEGVVVHFNRMSRPGSGITRESLLAMMDSVDRSAYDLAQAQPEVILYGCTSGSFLSGPGREDELATRITKGTGIAAYTTSTAVIRALEAVGAKHVFMLTPYPDDVNEHEIGFLRFRSISVIASDAFRCPTSEAIRKISSEMVVERLLAHRDAIADTDAVFISCTNLLALDQIERLERELGKPVVTSNQASLWIALSHLQVPTDRMAAGSLFRLKGAARTRAA